MLRKMVIELALMAFKESVVIYSMVAKRSVELDLVDGSFESWETLLIPFLHIGDLTQLLLQ